MSDIERIDQRLSAVERAVVDRDVELDELADLATLAEDIERLEARHEEHERRLAELEGTVDAIDGFVGNVESVNGDVERQADAAIAAVDRLEYRIDDLERTLEERGAADPPAVEAGSDGAGATGPPLEGAETARAAESGTDESERVTRFDGPGTASATSGGTDDDPFGEPDAAEETAGELLAAPADGADADEDANGSAVQRAIRQRLARADGADEPTADTDAGDASDDASTADDGESTALFASLRDRLP